MSENPAGHPAGAGERYRHILHITSADSWRCQRQGEQGFRDSSLDEEGFIHCSTVDQFLIPANDRYQGRDDLVLLVIDTELLDGEPIFEDCYDSGTRFPHLYGPIPLAAVIDVVDFPPEADGSFSEPADLRRRIAARAAGHDV